jgi:hypothetical protein
MVDGKRSRYGTLWISPAAIVTSEGETRLVNENGVQNVRIVYDSLIEGVEALGKIRDDDIGCETPARTGRQKRGIIRDQGVESAIAIDVPCPLAE